MPQVELSLKDLELAFQWLDSPAGVPVPKELEHLAPKDWAKLAVVLENLLEEQQESLLH